MCGRGGGGVEITHSQGEVGWYQGYHGNHRLLRYGPTLNPKPTSSHPHRFASAPHPPSYGCRLYEVASSQPPRRADLWEIERALPSDTRLALSRGISADLVRTSSSCGSRCTTYGLISRGYKDQPVFWGGFLIQPVDYSRARETSLCANNSTTNPHIYQPNYLFEFSWFIDKSTTLYSFEIL